MPTNRMSEVGRVMTFAFPHSEPARSGLNEMVAYEKSLDEDLSVHKFRSADWAAE